MCVHASVSGEVGWGVCVCEMCVSVKGRHTRLADILFLIISKHSLQTFIDQPQLHQSSVLSFHSSGGPVSHLTTPGLILP